MAKATLNKNGIATKAGDMTVYNFDAATGEYLSSSVEYLAVGVGIPGNACIDSPPEEKKGFAICRIPDGGAWEYITDHRGDEAYDVNTGQRVDIIVLGDYPEGITTLAPQSLYDKWNGSDWVHDENAQKAAEIEAASKEKNERLASAKNTISLWQTELQLGIISDDNREKLIAWMSYIQNLQETDIVCAPDIHWPELPDD